MIERKITQINLTRLKYLLLGVFAIEATFLIWVERLRLVNDVHELVMVSYILHSLLAFVCVIGYIGIVIITDRDLKHRPYVSRLSGWATFVIMIIVSVISLMDQVTHGHITLFAAYMLVFGLIIFIRPWWNVAIYAPPFVIFLAGVIFYQSSSDIAATHLINGSIVFVGMLFASTVFYRSFRRDLARQAALETKNENLQTLSMTDPLTKLPNRRHFEDQLTYIASINRRYNHEATLMLVDIDYFKGINDEHGHEVGDEILIQLSSVMTKGIRDADVLARWGGEEFMFLLTHTAPDKGEIVAERLRKSVEEHTFRSNNLALKITISIGVAAFSSRREDGFEKSYKMVDTALYQAKKNGRNQVVVKL